MASMATPTRATSLVGAALQHELWRSLPRLSSAPAAVERFLDRAGFDRAPWLAAAFAGGIAAWFALANRWQWLALLAGCAGAALAALGVMRGQGRYPYLRRGIAAMALMVAAGCLVVWAKSSLVGAPPIPHPMAPVLLGRVLERIELPAQGKLRLVLATREPRSDRAIRVRISVPESADLPGLAEGAVVRLRARLMPPSPPPLPGARDFAREAWFDGLAGSGSALGPVDLVSPGRGGEWLARMRHALGEHVRRMIPGSAGGVAATLVSGNRGGVSASDQQAMRDAGLTHLLAISGLHVSAVVAGGYFLAFRLLALWPWLVLRVRLPLIASAAGALSGIAYTAITGAHLPTVRALTGALLVLGAVALGRQPLSLRLLATAAMVVMLLWPEAVIGPSFQLSFGSVIAIIALHDCAPVRAFLAQRDEGWAARLARHVAMILVTGMVIDLALMPIALFHFHRAGVYGSVANVIAIPLTTFVCMPLIALALLLDSAGAGQPVWWAAGHSLDVLIAVAQWVSARPGAVTVLPAMGGGIFVLFVLGMLWLALWHGRLRLLGLALAVAATAALAALRAPDVLISGDGRNLGVTSADGAQLLVLRPSKQPLGRDAMTEVSGMAGSEAPLAQWPGVQCNRDFCLVELARGGRTWRILVARGKARLNDEVLRPACAGVDIVIARDKVWGPCHPGLLKADRVILMRTGGLALDLEHRSIVAVADSQGEHPWWRAPHRMPAHRDDDDDPKAGEEAAAGAAKDGDDAAKMPQPPPARSVAPQTAAMTKPLSPRQSKLR